MPEYGKCTDNCCSPHKPVDVSQVIYMKGAGGLEVHIDSDTDPFDTIGAEEITVDAVFRYKYDPSTYDLYVGCGGCMRDDPLVVSPIKKKGDASAAFEPFTQTGHFSVLPFDKFNASLLRLEAKPCNSYSAI